MDKLFREGFRDESPGFNEAAWEKMASALDAHEGVDVDNVFSSGLKGTGYSFREIGLGRSRNLNQGRASRGLWLKNGLYGGLGILTIAGALFMLNPDEEVLTEENQQSSPVLIQEDNVESRANSNGVETTITGEDEVGMAAEQLSNDQTTDQASTEKTTEDNLASSPIDGTEDGENSRSEELQPSTVLAGTSDELETEEGIETAEKGDPEVQTPGANQETASSSSMETEGTNETLDSGTQGNEYVDESDTGEIDHSTTPENGVSPAEDNGSDAMASTKDDEIDPSTTVANESTNPDLDSESTVENSMDAEVVSSEDDASNDGAGNEENDDPMVAATGNDSDDLESSGLDEETVEQHSKDELESNVQDSDSQNQEANPSEQAVTEESNEASVAAAAAAPLGWFEQDRKNHYFGLETGIVSMKSYSNDFEESIWKFNPTIGFKYAYLLEPKVTFNTGINYFKRSGMGRTLMYLDTLYSFGVIYKEEVVEVQDIHYLQVPLSVAVQVALGHYVEMGGFVAYGIVMQSNNSDTRTYTSGEVTYESWESNEWNGSYNRWDAGLLLGYRYRFTNSWALSLRGQYGIVDQTHGGHFIYQSKDRNAYLLLLLEYRL